MNGIIFNELEKFGQSTLGKDEWSHLIASTHLSRRISLAVKDYPDSEFQALITAISTMKGDKSTAVTLENFGAFIAPDLITMAQQFIDPAWKTVDLIANTEGAIHTIYRGAATHTHPPELKCQKTGSGLVTVHYTSSRRLCSLAKGIIRGISKHFGETAIISEPQCMLKGDLECELIVAVTA